MVDKVFIAAVSKFQPGIKVYGNTIHVFHDHQALHQGGMPVPGASFCIGGII